MVLHGGTGLSEEQFDDLISRGCAKVNISTALKIAFVDAHREYLEANPSKHDPPSLLAHVRAAVKEMAERHIRIFGSADARRPSARRPPSSVPALIFDCDGVLADTERDGHRPAFNQTFAEAGLDVQWSVDEYAEKLLIGGGKERMASLLTTDFVREHDLPADPEGQRELIAGWHRRKTAIYKEMVQAGKPGPSRGGAHRLRGARRRLDARRGVDVGRGVGPRGARARRGAGGCGALRRLRGRHRSRQETRPGDLRARPRAARRRPEAIVVEDSRNGLLAAVGAGLRCVVTVSGYTAREDMSEAVLVVSSLGDPGDAAEVLANRGAAHPGEYVTLADFEACLTEPLPQEEAV